jgi:small-conductance mechanosensitive channel
MDQYMGEVEKIGLKTTRIRSLSGEQIICSNSDLLSARIRNFKRMYERRVVFMLNLPFHTSVEQLQRAVELVTNILRSTDRVRFDRAHLMRISSSTFDLEVVYFVLHDDYNIFMDIHQIVLLEITRQFREDGLEFAYPTQNLLVRPSAWTEKASLSS